MEKHSFSDEFGEYHQNSSRQIGLLDEEFQDILDDYPYLWSRVWMSKEEYLKEFPITNVELKDLN